MKEMEEEADKLEQMQSVLSKQMGLGIAAMPLSLQEKREIDDRSVYVGNVDYGATSAELEAHFRGCGSVNRVTILRNKSDGRPKGFAYVEFGSKDFIRTALAMNGTLLRGRPIKLMPKRTNQPGISTTNRFQRGFYGGRGRGARATPAPCCHGTFRGTLRPT